MTRKDKKRKKNKKQNTAAQPPSGGRGEQGRTARGGGPAKSQGGQRSAAQRRTQGAGRVPGPDAFDNIPRRRPPNLPSNQPGQSTGRKAPPRYLEEERAKAGAAPPPRPEKGGKKQAARQDEKQRRAEAKKKKKARRRPSPAQRRRRIRTLTITAAVLLIIAGVWFSIAVLFKVDTFVIEGESPYTDEEIAAVLHIEQGENLFGFNAQNEAERLERGLPYLQNVQVRRRLPGTVVIKVEQAVETYYFAHGEGYAVLSTTCKVLRIAEEAPDGLIRIDGLRDVEVEPGRLLAPSETPDGSSAPPASSAPPPTAEEPTSAQGEGDPLAGTQPEDGTPEADNEAQGEPEAQPEEGAAEPEQPPEGAGEGDPAAEGEGESPPAEGENPEGEADPDEAAGGDPGEAPDETPESESVSAPAATDGAEVEGSTTTYDALMLLLDSFEEYEITGVWWIDVSDTLSIRFNWQGRITVELGSKTGLEQKMKALARIFADPSIASISELDVGVLDVSAYHTDRKMYFRPET